eukprot:SAG31_NODE_10567_length_1123_cov_7.217773_2_plen_122_part_00
MGTNPRGGCFFKKYLSDAAAARRRRRRARRRRSQSDLVLDADRLPLGTAPLARPGTVAPCSRARPDGQSLLLLLAVRSSSVAAVVGNRGLQMRHVDQVAEIVRAADAVRSRTASRSRQLRK